MTQDPAQNVAETVTFKLAPDIAVDQFITLMKITADFVQNNPGFVFRRRSVGTDGRWTDTVVWSDMDTAKSAAAAFPKQDFAPAVMAAINPETVQMRHEFIHWTLFPNPRT
ncbi:MAG: hypothetical protein ACI92Z_000836 [Paracoccaceae bacterium]|jgi:hypothetical protein